MWYFEFDYAGPVYVKPFYVRFSAGQGIQWKLKISEAPWYAVFIEREMLVSLK